LLRKKAKHEKKITTKSIFSLDKYKHIRNKVCDVTCARLRLEQDHISRHYKNSPKIFWNYIKTKTKTSRSIGDIRYVKDDGSLSFAKTDKDKANISVIISQVFLISKAILHLINSLYMTTCQACQVLPLIVLILLKD